jgi:predicted DNA-binding protein
MDPKPRRGRPIKGDAYSKPFSIRVRPEQIDQLDAVCERLGVGRSTVVRLALEAALPGMAERVLGPR